MHSIHGQAKVLIENLNEEEIRSVKDIYLEDNHPQWPASMPELQKREDNKSQVIRKQQSAWQHNWFPTIIHMRWMVNWHNIRFQNWCLEGNTEKMNHPDVPAKCPQEARWRKRVSALAKRTRKSWNSGWLIRKYQEMTPILTTRWATQKEWTAS